MLPFIRSPLALIAALALLPGCDDADDEPSDPLSNADVVRCEMAEDMACIEYQRVRSGKTEAFVVLSEARAVCAAGWLRDGKRPGTFAEGACSTEAALARCSVSRDYRELEAFSKFGGDLDAATKSVIDKGARNVEILKQPQYAPVPVEKQVAIIYLGTQGLLREVPVKRIKAFEEHFLMEMENKLPEVLAEFKKGNLTDDAIRKVTTLANELVPQYR